MQAYPYESIPVNWKRPPIDRTIMKECLQRSDLKGILHGAGTLAILAASGTIAYQLFLAESWGWMLFALYVHGGLYAFQPQTHELSHGTMFKHRWLNTLFKRIFELVFWTSNGAAYRMSHEYHHRYTLHRKSEGEEVHPRPEPAETLLSTAIRVVDVAGFLMSVYDKIYAIFVPVPRNTRRNVWQRYAYVNASRSLQREAYWVNIMQLVAHLAFAIWAISSGRWFLVVVVTLPLFYGGKWYHQWIHDTMHVGRQPETDDFRLCCRSVRLDPVSSFLYWHMEFHTEHHTFPGIPCYNLKRFHEKTKEHWEPPQTLFEAWREMNTHSKKLLYIPDTETEQRDLARDGVTGV